MQQVSTHLLIRVLIGWFISLLLLSYVITGLEKPLHKVEADDPVKVTKVVDNKQLQCLAENIYYEAGKESTEGKAAVARVVMNRIYHGFATTPCKVVYQITHIKKFNEDDESFWVKMCQFSWVCEGKGNPNKQDPRYQTSLQIAYDVLAYDAYDDVVPKSALFFHNTSVNPNWPHRVVAKIGNHVFYGKVYKKKRR